MSWSKICTFAAVAVGLSLVMMKASGGGAEIAFMTIIAISTGYALGSFQVMHQYRKDFTAAIKNLKDQ
jgi:hypothetical protein